MPRMWYQVLHPSGEYVMGVDFRPVRYWSKRQAEERARFLSAQYGRAIEYVKFPEPFRARRLVLYVGR